MTILLVEIRMKAKDQDFLQINLQKEIEIEMVEEDATEIIQLLNQDMTLQIVMPMLINCMQKEKPILKNICMNGQGEILENL